MSSRTRRVASKMAITLASSDNRTQAALARLEALENDNEGIEVAGFNVDDDDDDDNEASLDEGDDLGYVHKKQSKGTKHKTQQAKALEARRAPTSFLELLHENHKPIKPLRRKNRCKHPKSLDKKVCKFLSSICGLNAGNTLVISFHNGVPIKEDERDVLMILRRTISSGSTADLTDAVTEYIVISVDIISLMSFWNSDKELEFQKYRDLQVDR